MVKVIDRKNLKKVSHPGSDVSIRVLDTPKNPSLIKRERIIFKKGSELEEIFNSNPVSEKTPEMVREYGRIFEIVSYPVTENITPIEDRVFGNNSNEQLITYRETKIEFVERISKNKISDKVFTFYFKGVDLPFLKHDDVAIYYKKDTDQIQKIEHYNKKVLGSEVDRTYYSNDSSLVEEINK